MRRLPVSLIAALVLLLCGLTGCPAANASQRHMRKYKAPPPMARVVVTVLRAEDDKPLRNAAVVFHATQSNKDDGNVELKTNEEGKASLDIIPIGSDLLVQVIVPGYRTFGQKYDVPTGQKSITVKLLPPDEQYSVYKRKQPTSETQTNTPQTQMGHATPTDSPLLAPAEKKKHNDD